MTEFRLYRGTTTKYVRKDKLFSHPPRLDQLVIITPRIYFSTDEYDAAMIACIESSQSGGNPIIAEIDVPSRLRHRLLKGNEMENEWYVELPSWKSGLDVRIKTLRGVPQGICDDWEANKKYGLQ